MRPEHLEYFKDLLEGRAEISWMAWFRRHEAELKGELPRALRLMLDGEWEALEGPDWSARWS